MTQVKPVVLVCGNIFDGVSDCLSGSGEILIQDGKFAEVAEEVGRPRTPRWWTSPSAPLCRAS